MPSKIILEFDDKREAEVAIAIIPLARTIVEARIWTVEKVKQNEHLRTKSKDFLDGILFAYDELFSMLEENIGIDTTDALRLLGDSGDSGE